MTRLIRYQPFAEVAALEGAMERLFDNRFFSPYRFRGPMEGGDVPPRLDAYHTDEEMVIKAALPGVKPEEVDVSIEGDRLTIKGEAKAEEKVEEGDYLYREHRYGAFCRTVVLPQGLVTDKTRAGFENGMLTLTIPKAAKAKPKRIKVTAQTKAETKKAKADK